MQTIKPGKTLLFCKPLEAETQTKSGIFLTEKAAEKPKTAEVINVGSEVKEYQSKDRIIYKSYSTEELKLEGKDYFLVDVSDVLGKVVDTE